MMTEDLPATTCIGNRAGHLLLATKDRLRVGVAAAGTGEIHSWPGASQFDTRSFDQMIPSGPLRTGSFGTSLLDVFANPGAEIKFTVRKDNGHRKVFEYSFRVPLNSSHDGVKGSHGWRITAFISTDYHFAPIGDGEFLLPRRSEFNTFDTNGSQTDSVTYRSSTRPFPHSGASE